MFEGTKKILILTAFLIILPAGAVLPDWSETNLLPGETPIGLVSKNNLKIAASFYYPIEYLNNENGAREKTYPGVVLIHSWLRDRSDWLPLIPYLQKAGYAVIALDLRNHGLSDSKIYWHNASYDHLSKMIYDARAAYNYLAEQPFVDPKNISVMGVSIGAIIAVKLCAEINTGYHLKPISSAVLVSPAKNYFGVSSLDPIERCTNIPFLFVVDKQDPRPGENKIYTSGLNLYNHFRGQKKLLEFDGTGHGNKMINTQKFIDTALDWINSHRRKK